MNTLKKKKQELRIELKSKQLNLTREIIDTKSLSITKKIQNMKEYVQATKIAVFMSMEKEFNTQFLLTDIKKEFYIPKIEQGEMNFYRYTGEFELGVFGIKEPKSNEKINKYEIELMIVPYLGYNEAGYRIGYGKGYYDRYLSDTNFPVILPAIDDYLVDFDSEEFDKKIEYVIKND